MGDDCPSLPLTAEHSTLFAAVWEEEYLTDFARILIIQGRKGEPPFIKFPQLSNGTYSRLTFVWLRGRDSCPRLLGKNLSLVPCYVTRKPNFFDDAFCTAHRTRHYLHVLQETVFNSSLHYPGNTVRAALRFLPMVTRPGLPLTRFQG